MQNFCFIYQTILIFSDISERKDIQHFENRKIREKYLKRDKKEYFKNEYSLC